MAFGVQVTGLREASKALAQTPAQVRQSAEQAVNGTVAHIEVEARTRASQRVNLPPETLRDFIFARRASVRANGIGGSVTLQVKAVPLGLFDPRVKLVPFTGPDSRQRRYQNRLLPQVSVAIFRGVRAKALPGGFVSGQRTDGALADGERVFKRAGRGFGDRSDGSVGNKLTGFRFFTFPKRVISKLLPELQREAGKELDVQLRVAYRKNLRGFRVLRRND